MIYNLKNHRRGCQCETGGEKIRDRSRYNFCGRMKICDQAKERGYIFFNRLGSLLERSISLCYIKSLSTWELLYLSMNPNFYYLHTDLTFQKSKFENESQKWVSDWIIKSIHAYKSRSSIDGIDIKKSRRLKILI